MSVANHQSEARVRPGAWQRITRSLRGRYFLLTATLCAVILAGAWVASSYVDSAVTLSTERIAARNRFVQDARPLYDAHWLTAYALHAYALSPSKVGRERVHERIDGAIAGVDRVLASDWAAAANLRVELNALRDDYGRLAAAASALMQIRLDPDVLFPAIAIARGEMLSSQRDFVTAVSLALHEESPQVGGDPEAHMLLTELRYAWSQMVAAYRLYLINRISSLAESQLDIQTQDVYTLYQHVVDLLARLRTMDEQGRLGLQSSSALSTLAELTQEWYRGFEQVSAINLTEGWRADVPYFRDQIEPLLDSISRRIALLDGAIEAAGRADLADVARAAERIETGLLWTALAAFALIALGIHFFERTVLRPFALMADALKKEAMGSEGVALPAAQTSETRNLVDAFAEMRKQIRSRQSALEHQALHDALTALPNRTLLRDRLNQAAAAAHRERSVLALLMIDLDRFKEINDTLGHPVGDQVLQQVARRLTALLRESDTVARLGGDEFAILIPGAGRGQAVNVAEKVLRALESPVVVADAQLAVGASIGVALYPEHGRSTDALIQHADIAMYVAKRSRSGWSIYDAKQVVSS